MLCRWQYAWRWNRSESGAFRRVWYSSRVGTRTGLIVRGIRFRFWLEYSVDWDVDEDDEDVDGSSVLRLTCMVPICWRIRARLDIVAAGSGNELPPVGVDVGVDDSADDAGGIDPEDEDDGGCSVEN